MGSEMCIRDRKCGDAALARVKRLARGSVARALALSRRDLGPLDRDEQYAEGWLKITGKGEGTSKRNEFLFLNPDKHRPPAPGVVTFDIGAMDEYNLVLAGQIDRGDLPASPQSPKLAVGDLVWASAGDGKNSKFADRIVRVKVPRTPYHYTIGDILPDHLYHCERYDALCPACRVFGWVHGDAAKLQQTDRVAYAGRVRLSPGEMIHSEGTIDDPEVGIPLAILSTPKPTTTQFYLLKNGQPDSHITYDDKQKGALLRGRKVYRHHGSQPSEHAEGPEYERKGGIQDGQNRTVRGVLKKGAIFEFTLEFENLAALELGALLWSLTLEEGMHHRLGYAKPLGFGSVAIRIKEGGLRLISPERYSSLGAGGWIAVAEQQRRNWIGDFKTALTGLYGGADSFLDLPHIRDLLALTVTPDVEAIHYPRLEHVPQTEGENFKWFVANKKRRFPHVLGLPEDESPLPLNPGH